MPEKKEKNKPQGIDGNYIAEKKEGGKYTIKDVPIFAEVKEEGTKLETKITPDILKKIVAKAQLRATEGYFPPLHINHHDDNPNNHVMAIGFFMPTRVGTITYEGEATSVIFADLFGIEEHMFEAIKDVQFPYRSVEAKDLDGKEPEIIGLALLQHDTPFFRLPLLTISQEIDKSEKQVALSEKGFARAYQTIDLEKHLCRVFFSLGGTTIMSKKKKTKFEEEKDKEKQLEEEKEKEKLQEEEKEKEKKLQEEEEEKDKKFEEMPEDEKVASLYAMLKEVAKSLKGAQLKAEEKPEEKDPEKQKPTGPVELQLSRLEGEVVGLTDTLGKILNKETKKDLIIYAKGKLAKYNLTDVDKKLEPFAAKGKDAVDSFITGVAERGTTDPAISFDKFSAENIDDPLMIEFKQKSPEIYAKAAEANAAYKLQNRPEVDRKSFIENYIAGDGSTAPVEHIVKV